MAGITPKIGGWSAEERAYLVVSLGDAPAVAPVGGFELSLHGYIYAPASLKPPAVRIMVNGHECEARPAQDSGLKWVIHLAADAIEHRLIIISVHVEGAVRPCDAGESGDTRNLGVGLQQLILRESD